MYGKPDCLSGKTCRPLADRAELIVPQASDDCEPATS
jgi:hypothetical protein